MTTAPTRYAASILSQAKAHAASKRNNWPGMPLLQIPLSLKSDLHFLIDTGAVTIVERPRTVGEGTVEYIVAN